MPANTPIVFDELRENWLFLLIEDDVQSQPTEGITQPEIGYWQLGVANADQFVDSETRHIGCGSIHSNVELLTALLDELADYRYTGATIITPTTWTIQQLRRCLVAHPSTHASLRGLRHVSIEDLLAEYFGQTLSDYEIDDASRPPPTTGGYESSDAVESQFLQKCWNCWRQLFRLVPADELTGRTL